MKYELIITAEAQQEEADADNYYENIRKGLGEQFLTELSRCYYLIIANPLHNSYLDTSKILRYAKTKTFPYVIIYLISGNIVTVVSIRSTHKRPFA